MLAYHRSLWEVPMSTVITASATEEGAGCRVCDPSGVAGGDTIGSCTACHRRICGMHLVTWAEFGEYANPTRALMSETRLYATFANGSRQQVLLPGSFDYAKGWAEGQTRCTECRAKRARHVTEGQTATAEKAADRLAKATSMLETSSDPALLCAAFETLGQQTVNEDVYMGAWRRLTKTQYFRPPWEGVPLESRRSVFSWKPVECGPREPIWTAVFERAYKDDEGAAHGEQQRVWLSREGARLAVTHGSRPPWNGTYVLPAGAEAKAISSKDDPILAWKANTQKPFTTLERCYGVVTGTATEAVPTFAEIRQAVLDGYARERRRQAARGNA